MAKRFTAVLVAFVILLTSSLCAHNPFSGMESAGLFDSFRTVLQIDPVIILPILFPPCLLPVALVNRHASVYGLNTGIATPMAGKIYGLSCPLLFCKAEAMSGISLTGVSIFDSCQGLSVAACQNIGKNIGPALTVAFWQECSLENKGMQLGLVNIVSGNPSYHGGKVPLGELPKNSIYGELREDSLHRVSSYVTNMPSNAVQIGIFNSANDGLQIGIINRNPYSWLPYSPLFNFSRPRQPTSHRMTVSGLDLATWTTFSYTIDGLHLPSQTVSEVTYETITYRPYSGQVATEHFRKHRLGRSQPIHLIRSIIEYDQHGKIIRDTSISHDELGLFGKIISLTGEADRDIVLDTYDKMIAWHDQPGKLRALLVDRSGFFERRKRDQSDMAAIVAKGGSEPAYVTLAWQKFFPKYENLASKTFRNFRLLLKEQGITRPNMLAQHPELIDQLFLNPDGLSLAEISDAELDLLFVYCCFSPNQQDGFKRTPLMRLMHCAGKRTHSPLDWQRVLARFNSYGVDWSQTDAEGKRYLDYAVALQVDDMDAVLELLHDYCKTTLPAVKMKPEM